MNNPVPDPLAEKFFHENIGKCLFLFCGLLLACIVAIAERDWGMLLIELPFFAMFAAAVHYYFMFSCSAPRFMRVPRSKGHEAFNNLLRLPYERLYWWCIVGGSLFKIFL